MHDNYDCTFCVGGWASAPDGPYAWGYCFITENNKADYCSPSKQNGHALPANNIMAGDRFNSLSKSLN
jgi:hypothetical protein